MGSRNDGNGERREVEKKDVEALLIAGETVQFKPSGYSMYPLLVPGRDEVVVAPVGEHRLRRGDVVLYRRKDSILVWHRIWKVKEDGFYLVGDNQKEIEGPLEREQILGITKGMIRKGKYFSYDKTSYRMAAGLWLFLRPLRPAISKTVAGMKRLFRKNKQ